MVQKAPFRGWMIDAYKQGRIEDIPPHLLEIVADIVERQEESEDSKVESSED